MKRKDIDGSEHLTGLCVCQWVNLHRLLAKSILNALRCIALAPFSAHTCQYSTQALITVVSSKVIENSKLPFFFITS